ncbi:MAG: transcription-repair coupling factor, partial [Lachnospiraceae bacterium]|nr:transcription-repair coupling factor [Lachnospiraceae bacterium]MCF0174314.1 transcription-repair coupling factor [Bacteroidales bacterium]
MWIINIEKIKSTKKLSYPHYINKVFTQIVENYININSVASVKALLEKNKKEIFCKGLFFSARAVLTSNITEKGKYLVILPNSDDAEYFTNDLYSLLEGDDVFYLPSQKESSQKSNYKSTISVQRTSALLSLKDSNKERTIIVAFPESVEDEVPSQFTLSEPVISFEIGKEIKFTSLPEILFSKGFEKVDFVSSPGEFSLRGGIIDIFSFGNNEPYRISFFGDEVDNITIFDYNSQLSKEKLQKVEIYPDCSFIEGNGNNLIDILPEDTIIFLDNSELYANSPFMQRIDSFRKVYFQTPVGKKSSDVEFQIAPQPSFNKNFELLSRDIDIKTEQGYKVYIFGDKQSQIDRLSGILSQDGIIKAEFVVGKSLHEGFIDNESKHCYYTDHQIFDRFHRAVIRRTIQKSEQLTLNDLNSFKVGDYIVHIDYGVGIFGGLIKRKDEYGRPQEAIRINYKDNDVILISIHSLNKISRFKSKDDTPPTIHRLGSKIWKSLKESTKRKVKDIAKDLINLYAVRKSTKGYAFSADNYLLNELESSFMYEDTPDQMSAIQAVKKDMEDDCPMDRLICGDVGFGKTEVAIRAA